MTGFCVGWGCLVGMIETLGIAEFQKQPHPRGKAASFHNFFNVR